MTTLGKGTTMTTDTHLLGTGQEVLRISPVIPVVVIDEVADAVPLARALARGGVRVMEITLRTEAGLGAIERVAAEVPETTVGAGTVTTPEEAAAAQAAGARFVVTPGATDRLLDAVLGTGLPLLAGASTLTEILRLRERGLRVAKFFPAEAAGGVAYLSAVAGPVPDVSFCPTGGITPRNAADYLALPNVACVGGSWLTPRAEVRAGNWAEIERLAAEAAGLGAVG
jgi:2-dehydro-3-deoxyphosphogluconate aldolase/(4S)-4-hydroxy-2-oxoglutarate aldolase